MTPYQRPALLFNAHLETVYPALFRSVNAAPYTRERIATPDDDFLDLDWMLRGATQLVVISHGLEGNSSRAYVRGMAKIFFQAGYDVLAWNYRGCSEEINRQLRFYHSGATDDLATVLQHAWGKGYATVFLIGFSLGGNLTLKFLGETGAASSRVQGACVFSVPLHLQASCRKISSSSNRLYAIRFLKSLKEKIRLKARLRPELSTKNLDKITDLLSFDDAFTAPLHGFASAVDYYTRCSSLFFLDKISVPTLIVNAHNDPFLSIECFPAHSGSSRVQTEWPQHGGHVGFAQFSQNGLYWSEQRALRFIQSLS
jgi:hypothetical protein